MLELRYTDEHSGVKDRKFFSSHYHCVRKSLSLPVPPQHPLQKKIQQKPER